MKRFALSAFIAVFALGNFAQAVEPGSFTTGAAAAAAAAAAASSTTNPPPVHEDIVEALHQKTLAEEAYDDEDYAVAWEHAKRAHELDPNAVDIQWLMGQILYKDYRFEEAIPVLEPLAEAPSSFQAEALEMLAYSWFFLGNVADEQGRADEALTNFQKAYPLYQKLLTLKDVPYDSQRVTEKKLEYLRDKYPDTFK